MADEARRMWREFITAPENVHLLRRYAKSAKEPAALFDNIGEDLANSNQEVREQAYWVLVMAMPLLTRILYEREIWEPEWRDRKGKDQQFINPGMNILTHLHDLFVVERHFKIDGQYGKDPRRFVNKIVKNKMKDGDKKRNREVQLDDGYALKIPDPEGSVEDIVLKNRELDDIEKEFLALRFYRNEKERSLGRTVFIDETPLAEAAESNGISSEVNLRQIFSRMRKHAVVERDALFTYLLFCGRQTFGRALFGRAGKLHRPSQYLTRSPEWLIELAAKLIQPKAWLNEKAADGKNSWAVLPLTTSFSGAPGHIYLVAYHRNVHHDFVHYEPFGDDESLDCSSLGMPSKPPLGGVWGGQWASIRLYAKYTELPGVNDALAKIPRCYKKSLVSSALDRKLWLRADGADLG